MTVGSVPAKAIAGRAGIGARRAQDRPSAARARRCARCSPPPAPISISSIERTCTGRPLPRLKRWTRAISNVLAIAGSPSLIRHIFAVVPPMSNETRSRSPISAAVEDGRQHAGRRARLDEPDREARRGLERGDPSVREHEVEVRARTRPRRSRCPSVSGSARRAAGRMRCTTVVDMRSYSRISGATSHESDTATSGMCSASHAPTSRSWLGFAKEWRKHTADGLDAGRFETCRAPPRARRSSGDQHSAPPSTRSSTSSRSGRGTSGSGSVISRS